MALLNSVAQLQEYVSNGPTDGIEWAALLPTYRQIVRRFVKPIFPENLVERWSSNAPTPTLNETEIAILGLLREAVAHLTTWKYTKKAPVLLTGSGTHRREGENLRAAFRDDKQEYKEDNEADGLAALEEALYYAVRHKNDIPEDFNLSDEYETATAHLVNFTHDFDKSPYRTGYKTFLVLKPICELIERESVILMLGQTLYDELVMHQYDGSQDKRNRELVKLLRGGIVQIAVNMALQMNTVLISGNMIIVRELRQIDDVETRSVPRMDLLNTAIKSRRDLAHRYFAEARNYLSANAAFFDWTAPVRTVYKSNRTEIGLKDL